MNMNLKNTGRRVKGQAALEYLVTYGWAILVILIVGVTVWQMGIGGKQPVVPGCSGFSQIVPLDTKLTASDKKLQIFIRNDAGTRLDVTGVNATIWSYSGTGSAPGLMRPGRTEVVNITFTPASFNQGDYYRANIVIEYENVVSGITHKSSGDCWGEVD
jgi:hypothetical protein